MLFLIVISSAYLYMPSCANVMNIQTYLVLDDFQDWDFPHFTKTLDVNLPGFNRHEISFKFIEIEISGKWFNYGIIFLVMLFDLNMWKNQIFYKVRRYLIDFAFIMSF